MTARLCGGYDHLYQNLRRNCGLCRRHLVIVIACNRGETGKESHRKICSKIILV